MKINRSLLTFSMCLLCLVMFSNSVISAETITYIGINGKITDNNHAIYMEKTNTSKNSSIVDTYIQKGRKWEKIGSEQYKLINDSTYEIKEQVGKKPVITLRTYKKQSGGIWMFRELGKNRLKRTGYTKSLIPLILQGEVVEYYQNGKTRSKSIYENNELVSNENWLENGEEYVAKIFYSVDTATIFNTGESVLYQHVLNALKEADIDIVNITGTLVIGFVVMENGKIDGIRILKGLGPHINNVVYNSIYTLPLKGNWTPAMLNAQTVRYFQVFPINFKPDPATQTYSKVLHNYMEWDRKW